MINSWDFLLQNHQNDNRTLIGHTNSQNCMYSYAECQEIVASQCSYDTYNLIQIGTIVGPSNYNKIEMN